MMDLGKVFAKQERFRAKGFSWGESFRRAQIACEIQRTGRRLWKRKPKIAELIEMHKSMEQATAQMRQMVVDMFVPGVDQT